MVRREPNSVFIYHLGVEYFHAFSFIINKVYTVLQFILGHRRPGEARVLNNIRMYYPIRVFETSIEHEFAGRPFYYVSLVPIQILGIFPQSKWESLLKSPDTIKGMLSCLRRGFMFSRIVCSCLARAPHSPAMMFSMLSLASS